jgi:hypothetical protein
VEPKLNDSSKLIWIKAGSANQGTIDVWLCHEFCDVRGLD